MTFTIHGLSVSNGVAIGRALTISAASLDVNHHFIEPGQEQAELKRLENAFALAQNELKQLQESLPEDAPEEMDAFLDVHRLILADPELQKKPRELILKRRYNAAWALTTELDDLLEAFADIEDPYLKERGADFRQVVERVLVALQDTPTSGNQTIHKKMDRGSSEVIIVAQDIAPHDMLRFKDLNFCAFVTDLGGKNSHTAIVARSLDIPAAVGVRHASKLIQADDLLIVDGERGLVIVDPAPVVLEEYQKRQQHILESKKELQLLRNLPAITTDGLEIRLLANIEMPEDVPEAIDYGALGVGLFRSEFLFMNRKGELPNEEEQFDAYLKTVTAMGGAPVNIRTIDIGADKSLDAEEEGVDTEISPLGLRGIRWSLSEPEIFLTQLRAILRASAFGDARIMIPMLAQAQEIELTLSLVDRAKAQLDKRKVSYNKQIQIGAMIEIPAAIYILPTFLKHFDFLSIGTNDLIQYTLGIDRADNSVAHLYDPLHPAILHMIHQVITASNAAHKSVSVCGEMAGDAAFTKLLLGMGLRDFSMHARQILTIKKAIRGANQQELMNKLPPILSAIEPTQVLDNLHKLNH